MSQDMVNYHGILGELKGVLDPIITTMRQQEPTGGVNRLGKDQ